jgi:hypothetical protein
MDFGESHRMELSLNRCAGSMEYRSWHDQRNDFHTLFDLSRPIKIRAGNQPASRLLSTRLTFFSRTTP